MDNLERKQQSGINNIPLEEALLAVLYVEPQNNNRYTDELFCFIKNFLIIERRH